MTIAQATKILTQMAENPPWEYTDPTAYVHAMYTAIDILQNCKEK